METHETKASIYESQAARLVDHAKDYDAMQGWGHVADAMRNSAQRLQRKATNLRQAANQPTI